jgi:hypothetical protein
MVQRSRSHGTSALAGTLVVLLGSGLAAALTTSAASASAARPSHRASTALRGFSTAPATRPVNGTVTDRVVVRPRTHRVVKVQAKRPGSTKFVTVSSEFSNKHGRFSAVLKPTAAGSWRFRLLLPRTATATRLVSPSRTITATNPVTTAALSLNGSQGATAKQTVGVSQAFDFTGTHAGTGLSLLSGTLDYGDGTTEAFHGDPSTWDSEGHRYVDTRTFTAKLTVVDSALQSASTSIDVTVYAEPTATISVRPGSELEQSKPIRFDVTSQTPEGTSFTDFDHYSLDSAGTAENFRDGGLADWPGTFSITFPTAGTYTVAFEGSNDAGATATAEVQVVIKPRHRLPR